jgi:hypothetical protein
VAAPVVLIDDRAQEPQEEQTLVVIEEDRLARYAPGRHVVDAGIRKRAALAASHLATVRSHPRTREAAPESAHSRHTNPGHQGPNQGQSLVFSGLRDVGALDRVGPSGGERQRVAQGQERPRPEAEQFFASVARADGNRRDRMARRVGLRAPDR